MTEAYAIQRLSPSQIDLAHLLISATGSGPDRGRWLAFCRRIIEWRGATGLHDDVLVATDPAGHIKGVCVTQVVHSMLMGRTLDVPMFVTVSAADEDGVTRALISKLRDVGREARCDDVRIWSQGGQSWLRVVESSPDLQSCPAIRLAL